MKVEVFDMKMMADVYKIFKDLLSYLPNNPNKIVYTKTISEGYRNFIWIIW